MKTYQACHPCITHLMASTLEMVDIDSTARQEILDRVQQDLTDIDMSLPPGRNAGVIYQKTLQEIGQGDIFLTYKQNSIHEALKLYPRLKQLIASASDPLKTAIHISALGNIIDVANPNRYDLDDEISRLMEHEIRGESMDLFRTQLENAEFLLILADNAGETVFDRVLIETIAKPVIYAVKSGPAFDDALMDDAVLAGLDQVSTLIETGTSYPGTYLPSCSADFQELFQNASLILSKGQANFETLSDTSRDIFFLLKVKCDVVSEEIGYPVGSLTLKHYQV